MVAPTRGQQRRHHAQQDQDRYALGDEAFAYSIRYGTINRTWKPSSPIHEGHSTSRTSSGDDAQSKCEVSGCEGVRVSHGAQS